MIAGAVSVPRPRTLAAAQLGVSGCAVPPIFERELPSFGGATAWLNSRPLSADALRGKVILVQFCTYTCINWLRTLPYVRAWDVRAVPRGPRRAAAGRGPRR